MTPNPKIVAEFDAITWHFLPENEETILELEDRLLKAAAGRRAKPLVYSDWVREVQFLVPSLFRGEPFTMETENWQAQYTHVIGDTLGWINARSYKAHGILLSSMAINKDSNQPGDRFFGLAHDVGLFDGKTEGDRIRFWSEQMELVREFVAARLEIEELPDLASMIVFVTEGELKVKEVPMRTRCAVLANAAREAHRSPDGLLRCAACDWHKPEGPIVGEIVQLHHLDPIANASNEGRRVNLAEAKELFAPLCPTCHVLSHSKMGEGLFGLQELKNFAAG